MAKITSRIAVFGGSGYLASLLKNQDFVKNFRFTFFSRKKIKKDYITYLRFKKKSNILKKFDYIIHLAGPNNIKLKNNKNLIKKKNQLTSTICDLCLNYNIKLIYISSLQVYKNYGKANINKSSIINLKNFYSKSHYNSERIIIKKFLNRKKMFTILRMGNVFGFKKYNRQKKIEDNLIHSFCFSAVKKKEILIKNGHIQRTFVPSRIFIQVINLIIKKDFFNNSIENIFYKNFNLNNVAKIIQKRVKILFNFIIKVKMKRNKYENKFKISPNRNFKFIINNKNIYSEIDQILKIYKKN